MVNPIQYERAAIAWPVLTEAAAAESTITYAALARHLGIHPRPIRFVLGVIQDYCLREKLPPLTILVVNQRGVPGEGFIAWDIDDLPTGYRRVYAEPWDEYPNPFGFAKTGTTLEELAQRLVTKPEESKAVYGLIKNRGIAQDVFRRALLLAYRHSCAFCGLSLQAALEAAHIIRWSEATIEQRLDPSNGLLLCATHHALFDAHVLTVTVDRKIAFRPPRRASHSWTDADQSAAISLNGRSLQMPLDPRLQASDEALQYRARKLPEPAS
jgi:putative restriction endonuclease